MSERTEETEAPADELSPYETCVVALDRHAQKLGSRAISHDEYEAMAYAALSEYFEADRPEDDVALLLQYARLPIENLRDDPLRGDRAAIDVFDRQLRGLLHFPATEVTLAEQIARIEEGLAAGDPDAEAAMVDLCRDGWREQPHVFMFRGNVETALLRAAELGQPGALQAALNPVHPSPGPLAAPEVFNGFARRLAFDLLGHLATRPDEVGYSAIDHLIHLCSFLETAGAAAVRLPAHRLHSEQREALHRHLEAISELLAQDPFLAPVHDSDRIPHILRSVLWLANDASRVD